MVIIMIILAALPVVLLLSAFKDGMEILGSIYGVRKYFIGSADTTRYRRYLDSFHYYKQLTNEGKDIFFNRLLKFMYSKEFKGKQGLEVTDEMKVLISASAVQLTFGLKRFRLQNLDNIHVYPKSFYFGLDKREFKGATSQGGNMYLSWEDFKDGYLDPNDRYNLGLHEMSHALKLDVLMSSRFDAHFGSYLDEWLEISTKEFERMKHGSPSFLRSYAKTNKHEFFAVCVEHFFECPEEFRKALPDVYNHLVILLNQNPLNTRGDYRVDEFFVNNANKDIKNIPLPREVRRNFKYASWHWSLYTLFAGIPAAGFTFLYMGRSIAFPMGRLGGIISYCRHHGAGTMELL